MSAAPTAPAVVVPVKAPDAAKSRLSPALDAEARAELVRAMLTDVLAAVRAVHDGALLVVSPDAAYDAIVARFGATRTADAGTGYNAAVALALRSAVVHAAGAAAIVPADQPRARPDDIERLLAALAAAEVVLVPALDGGTGALALRPPDAIVAAFGERSAAAHERLAREAGRRFLALAAPSLRHDVDTVDDLLASDAGPLGSESARFVATHRGALETERAGA